jgi:hypothetical protein
MSTFAVGGVEVRKCGDEYVAVFELDAADCENIAGTLSPSDRWADDLRYAACFLREINIVTAGAA